MRKLSLEISIVSWDPSEQSCKCVRVCFWQALGVESSQDRALIKKKLKDLKVLMEKARRNREKTEKQRKKELEPTGPEK